MFFSSRSFGKSGQVVFLFLLFTSFGALFGALALLFIDVFPSDNFFNLKVVNAVGSVGIFIGGSYTFLYIVRPKGFSFKFRGFKLKYLLVSVAVYLLANIVSVQLENINRSIPMPSLFESFVIDEQLVKNMAYSKNIAELLVNIFFIALVPAVAEEILFRGLLMNLFIRWSNRLHTSVILSSLIFSLVHFNFYTIIPIFFMGCVLGYVYHYTQSIWTNIIIHFINNAVIVMGLYIYGIDFI